MTFARIILLALAALRITRFFTSDKLGEWWLVGPAKLWATRREARDREPDDIVPMRVTRERFISDALRERVGGSAVSTPFVSWGWRSKLVSGLDCPFCVGFWVGVLVLLGDVLTRRVRPLRALWTFAAGALALNYVTGHISSRLDG